MFFLIGLLNYLPNDQQTSFNQNLLAYNDECSFYDKNANWIYTREGKAKFFETHLRTIKF
jgi:hypothetical protein